MSARRALVFIMVAAFALSLVAVAPATAGQAGLATDAPDVYVVRVSGQREQRSFTETWTANVTFDLEQEERSPNGKFVAAYYRARSGSVNWEISGDDEGACSWRQRFSFRVGAGINNGQLRFGGGRYAASIAAQVDSVTARKLRDRGGEYGCVSVPLRVSPDGEWLSDGLGKGHAGDPLRGSSSSEGKVEWNLDPRYREGGLRAVAGGPHSVQRGRKVQLDGSLSTPKPKIKSYRWTYTLGPSCPKGTRPAEKSGSTKATTSFVVLCRVHALLTVRDGKGHEATDTAVVTVQPRPASIWRTTTDFGVRRDVSLPGFTVPTVYPDGPSVVTHALLRCPDGIGVEVFCTYGKARYQLAPPVDDPGGPFNGWSYVGAPQMKIDKVAFMNPFLEPNAPPPDPRTLNWYWYNASQGVDVNFMLANTLAHEGYGYPSIPRSGHFRAMVDFIRAGGDHNDPVRFLETRIGPTRQALERSTDGCLDKIEAAAFKYSNDPLLEFLAARWYFAWSRGPFLDEWVRVDTERPRTPPPMPLPLLDCAKE